MLFQYSITLEVDILPRQLMAQSVWNFIQLSFHEIRYLPSEFIKFSHTFFGSFRTFTKVNCKACVPPNDFLTDKKIGRLFLTKKIG